MQFSILNDFTCLNLNAFLLLTYFVFVCPLKCKYLQKPAPGSAVANKKQPTLNFYFISQSATTSSVCALSHAHFFRKRLDENLENHFWKILIRVFLVRNN